MHRPNVMQSEHQQRVEEFMDKAGQELPEPFTQPDEKTRILRAKLIFEEAMETIRDGLGVVIKWQRSDDVNIYISAEHRVKEMQFDIAKKFSMIDTIDGCMDIMVVTTGTMSSIGAPDKPFQEEVDNNNLAKFGPGGYRNEDGKWVKSPDHKPPRIKEVMERVLKECESYNSPKDTQPK